MSESSKSKKYLMCYKVNELSSKNYKRIQITSLIGIGIHRQTVGKYQKMTEDESFQTQSFECQYPFKLEEYEQFIVG